MRAIERSGAFKRDYRRVKASPRLQDLGQRLRVILELLIEDRQLLPAHRDHALTGDWVGYRECHVPPDLLLIYDKPQPDLLRLVRLGSHVDVFR
jgi:mRNA interferase YafQ